MIIAFPFRERALKIREQLFSDLHRLELVFYRNIHHTVGDLHRHGANLIGREYSEAAPLDHGRAANTNVAVSGGDHDIAAPEQYGIASKAAPRGDADSRHKATHLRVQLKGKTVEAGDARSVSVAWPSAASFRNQDDGQLQFLCDLKHAVFLAVILQALSPGKNHVVVAHEHALGVLVGEELAVHASNASDHAITRGVTHQIIHRAPTPLGCDCKTAIFDKCAGVANVAQIFPCGSMVGLSPLCHCFRAILIKTEAMTFVGLSQIGANVVEVKCFLGIRC